MPVKFLPGGAMSWEAGNDQDEYTFTDVHGNPAQRFKDKAQMLSAMKNPAYKTSESYRRECARLAAGSTHIELAEHNSESKTERQDELDRGRASEVLHEKVRDAFRDPRYRTSPSYRAEVEQMVRDGAPIYDALEPSTVINRMLTTPRSISVDGGGITGPMSPKQMAELNGSDDNE